MMEDSSSRPLVARPLSKPLYMLDGPLDALIFQLLRQADLCTSMAWHSIWRV